MLIQTGIQSRRFNTGQNTAIRRIENWKKYGSVRMVDFGGRSNVICLQNKKRKARLTHKISLRRNQPFILSIDVFSPVDNQVWGVGSVSGSRDLQNGMWKTVSVGVNDGDEVKIEAMGRDDQALEGDRCYVDLSSIKVRA